MSRLEAEESFPTTLPIVTDDSTLTGLLRELMPELLRYFGRRVPTPDDAADCLGDTMVVLWRRRESLPVDHESARQYAYGVAANVLRESQRGRARHLALSERARALFVAPSVFDADNDCDDELWQALRELRDIDRELVLLVAWEGFGVGEAGNILGLSDQASRARYSRARKRLRRSLTSSGEE